MLKRLFILCSFFSFSLLFCDEYFSYSGINYHITEKSKDFVLYYKNKIPSALKMNYANYNSEDLYLISYACSVFDVKEEEVYSPSSVICYSCKYQLSVTESSNALINGYKYEVCPHCKKSDNFVFLSKLDKNSFKNVNMDKVLIEYFRYLAIKWWPGEGTRSMGICDRCSTNIKTGNGYVYGYINAGQVHAYRLWCDQCMSEIVTWMDFDSEDNQAALDYQSTKKK